VTAAVATWTAICRYDELPVDRPVPALVAGRPVAVVRLADGTVHALDAVDPACGATVLPRGIVGDRAGVPVLISPMFKHPYALHTGACLTDDRWSVTVHPTRTVGGVVEVGR